MSMTETPAPENAVVATTPTPTPTPTPALTPATATQRASRRIDAMPVLEQLARLYPQLFGAAFQPLKRGIFQDLLQTHPDAFDSVSLKAALAQHTRSTRYLVAVAEGRPRLDLSGQAVEPMAPEHVHHALLEVFRRRQARSKEDLAPTLRRRMAQAFARSGLTPEAYAGLVHSRDEQANQLLDEAMQESRAAAAKDEALLRAFDASGQAVDAFADMYGMDGRSAGLALDRARHARAAAARLASPA